MIYGVRLILLLLSTSLSSFDVNIFFSSVPLQWKS